MQSNSSNQARWIGLALWGSLLVVLLLSSITIADVASRSNWINSTAWGSYFPDSGSQSLVIPHHNPALALLAQVIMVIVVSLNIMRACLRFVRLSLQLLIAYSKLDLDDDIL